VTLAVYREKRIAVGGCVDCSSPAEPGKKHCKRHRELRREHERAAYARKRERLSHPCANCGDLAFKAELCRRCAIGVAVGRSTIWETPLSLAEVDAFLESLEGSAW